VSYRSFSMGVFAGMALFVGAVSLSACKGEAQFKAEREEKPALPIDPPIQDILRWKDRPLQDVDSAIIIDKETGCEYVAILASYGQAAVSIRYGQNGHIMCPTKVRVNPDGSETPIND